MADRVVCPRCGVPFAPGEAVCPRDGSPRPGGSGRTPNPKRAPAPEPAADTIPKHAAPMLDEEPRTEQVDPGTLDFAALPKISLKPDIQPLKRLPGIPMESQPAVRPTVAPQITPVQPSVVVSQEATQIAKPPTDKPEKKTGERKVPKRTSSDESLSKALDDKLIGQKVGDYLIQERIGTGGMGHVYRGVQPLIGATVAIKVLRPEAAGDPQQVQRLLSEARVVNAIRHRGIVDIFNFAKLPDGRHCVVMELLQGHSLEALIQTKGRLPLEEALPYFEECLDALAAAHKAGVIHRDLKPSNIFIVEQHGKRYAKLLDFGIAKQSMAPDGLVAQTVMTRFMGTPGFVAPEQARAQPVGPLTDLYALGVVMFLTLSGRPPFEAETPYELVRMHVELPPPRPSSFESKIPAALDALILSMMAKSPADRPQGAEVVRDRLASLRAELPNAPKRTRSGGDGLKATTIARPAKQEAAPAAITDDVDVDETITRGTRPKTLKIALIAGTILAAVTAAVLLLR